MDCGGRKDYPPAASTFEAGDGELPGLESVVGQDAVDFGGQGSKGLGGGDLHPHDLSAAPRARVRVGYVVDAPEPIRGGVNDDHAGSENSAHGIPRTFRADAGHVAGGDEPAAARRGAGPLARDMSADHFPRAGGGMLGGMVRPAALLGMQVGALTLISDLDAPWPNQLVAFLMWLAGCVALFLSWR